MFDINKCDKNNKNGQEKEIKVKYKPRLVNHIKDLYEKTVKCYLTHIFIYNLGRNILGFSRVLACEGQTKR